MFNVMGFSAKAADMKGFSRRTEAAIIFVGVKLCSYNRASA